MSRRVLAWFLSVPLIAAGVEGGHWLIYRLVYPDPYIRAQVLAQTGHHYLDYVPFAFGVAGAVAVCAFGSRIFTRARGPEAVGRGQVSLLPFLVAAPVAFALQECIERLFAGSWPFAATLDPTFLPGVALQLPIGVVLFLLARWLLRAADRLRLLVLGDGARRLLPVATAARAQTEVVDLSRLGALAAGFGERGPPPVLMPALAVRS